MQTNIVNKSEKFHKEMSSFPRNCSVCSGTFSGTPCDNPTRSDTRGPGKLFQPV